MWLTAALKDQRLCPSALLYTGQHSMPNIGSGCQKNACNDTFVKIRHRKGKVEYVIQVMSILSSVDISFHKTIHLLSKSHG